MNLNESILRIKKIIRLISESELPYGFDNVRKITNEYDSDVEELQKFLNSKNYYLGYYGPNQDGVDGIYGKLTRKAHLAYMDDISADEFNFDIKKTDKASNTKKNIIIGDSQTPYVDMNTLNAERVSKSPGISSLWEGGKTVSWLINALQEYPISPDVENVVIVIGTNGGFGKYSKDNIPQLFNELKDKFPNAKYLVVKGSWGWGGLKNIDEDDVNRYYDKFEQEGANIINTPIGKVEPHSNLPVYAKIGNEIDRYLS